MVKQVVASGWLDGRLKPQQEEPAAAPAPQEAIERRPRRLSYRRGNQCQHGRWRSLLRFAAGARQGRPD